MKSVAISRFKTHCLSLLEDVARTGQPLLVLKRGKPLARVLPNGGAATERPQDTLRGTVTYLADIIGAAIPASAWEAREPEPPRRVRRH